MINPRNKLSAIILLATTILSGCIETYDFKGTGDLLIDGITINSLLSTDTTMMMYVMKANSYQDINAYGYEMLQLSPALKGYKIPVLSYMYDKGYIKSNVLADASISLAVNGTSISNMVNYDDDDLYFKCDYRPQSGDKVELSVSHPNYPTATVSVTIPTPQKIEVLSVDKVYKEKGPLIDTPVPGMTDADGIDSVARIKLRIKEDPTTTGYYRLRVTGYGYLYKQTDTIIPTWLTNDVYTSDDLLFHDSDITESYAGWDAYFLPMFDNKLFTDGEYTFTIDTRIRRGSRRFIRIELQTIDEMTYHNLHSVMVANISDKDAYTEPVQIISNVDNGWGNLSAMATERLFIKLDE